ncbi:Riboflavin synthase-like beta-barrel [Penicillium cf. griseofulvum]|uniref:Riboflavin synthase-like beta-barrel n=1 Tax=Penicillium cf. griseofulvum TaxID=2972120 RepID=A0A9W9J459_9EURO|nr:Riboflavin synthase-like beta-barrel [Penicillium cf. griseofulvum]KAJ5435145.1 Riboflavin synthase-like beta-barrel [Penicillium cf. griseofulvum]KAJ5452976.1 Riboflavin synthase-like beta-barrel [Penicillium cf. griseofulvum]
MASLLTNTVPWHEGEKKLHDWLQVPHSDNPTTPYLSPRAAFLVQQSPLLALGTLDTQGRPWSTIWGGTAGFATPVAESLIELRAQVDSKYDPVVQALLTGNQTDAYIGKMVSGLAIDLENRQRVKLYGRMVAGSLSDGDTGNAQLVVRIEESLGNCPKYMNKKHIVPAEANSKLISDSPQLSPAAVELLSRADTMFVSSSHRASTMDTNIRGGPPGFMRVESNDVGGAVIVYPEYSGNRHYQTLGNLETTPLAGFVVPDFDSGNVLYFTGSTEILAGKDAAAILPRSNLAVRVTMAAAIFVENGLGFRGEAGDPSPYNPSVRYLVNEKQLPGTQDSGSDLTATLIKKEDITPSIQRFRFRISGRKPISWNAGQYVTLSFEDELNMGYSHMRDDDPTSLNDDYVRTFTVSSYPGRDIPADQFEIMVRQHGPVTRYLSRVNERAGLEVPLKGFGGSFHISTKSIAPYVAGGIGITPLLAQLPELDISQLRLFWSISMNDLGLVHDVFQRWPQLPLSTTLFITNVDLDGVDQQMWDGIQSGVKMIRRRMQAEDLDRALADIWYVCAGVGLKQMVLNWLVGKTLVYEDFNY